MSLSFFINVIDFSVISSNNNLSTSLFISSTILSKITLLFWWRPALYLAINIFLTEYFNLFSVIIPLLIAFLMLLVLSSKSSGISKISFPANNALTSADWFLLKSTTPFISIASVITKPSNFNFFFKSLEIIFFDKVEGILGSFSKDGTSIWATITLDKLLSINFLYGNNSTSFILLAEKLIVGKVLWESVDVSPWPGKCLAEPIIPSDCIPIKYDNDLFVTLNLSSPNDLLPMIGLLGFVLISVTGAKLMWTPILLAWTPILFPTLYINDSLFTAPRVIL